MATANTALRITELDFFTIKENLKTFLRSQDRFSDYDFEGSGLNVLLDLLAYNTHYMGYFVNMDATESQLMTAQLRDSIVSRAKLINYVPTSMLGSAARANIVVTPGQSENQNVQTITLDKYTRLVSENNDGVAYGFVVMQSKQANKANGCFTFSNVAIKQGEVITTQTIFDAQANDRRVFNIPSANCDTTTISVIVQESTTNTYNEIFELADDITEVTANSRVFYIEESSEANNTYSIQFGDGYLGKRLKNGNIVIITYLDTVGEAANKQTRFTVVGDIDNFSSNISVSVAAASAGGSEKENIEQIRFRAPIFYTAQNRAVTENDYESLLLKDYPNIQAISVWGGEKNDPPIYGKIFISMKPKDGFNITTEEKERIKAEIIANRSVMTVIPEIVDPEFLYLLLNVTVRYDPKLTSYDEDELKALIRTTILDYNDTELTDFGSVFRSSQLLRQIDAVDQSIRNSEFTFYVQKRFEPALGFSRNYTINYKTALRPGGVFDKIYSYPSFTVRDSNNDLREVQIEEVTETLTGISSIAVRNSGANYTSMPSVVITGDGIGATATAKVVNGKIVSITLTNIGTGYTQATVTIVGGGGEGAEALAILQANRASLQTYYFKTNGEKVIVNSSAGSIQYDTGIVTLLNFFPLSITQNANYEDSVITINSRADSSFIEGQQNQFISIDENDSAAIQITLIAEE